MTTWLIFAFVSSYAQKIENIKVSQMEDDIMLSFDLYPKVSIQEQYNLSITSSYDDYRDELTVKRGRTKNVKPIMRISLVIDGREHFRGYKGDMAFKIKARMTYAPITFTKPVKDEVVHSGSHITFSWRGGYRDDRYSILLFKKGSFVKVLKSGISGQSYTWRIPEKGFSGSGYRAKLVPSENEFEPEFSHEFKIREGG